MKVETNIFVSFLYDIIYLGNLDKVNARYGYNSTTSRYNAWNVNTNGNVNNPNLTNTNAVRHSLL